MYSLHIGLTGECNQFCKHCYSRRKRLKNNCCLNENELINAIEKIGASMITYTYGENLLYNNFFQFAQKFKEKKYYQTLISNGWVIQSYEIVKKIQESGINEVCISIDSAIASKHDKNRGVVGAFEKAINAVKLLLQSRMTVTLAISISDKNIAEALDIIYMGENLGVKNFSFMRQRNINGMKQMQEQYPFIMEKVIIYCISQNILLKMHDFTLNSILKHMKDENKIDEKTYEQFLDMNSCHAFKEILLITPNGDIYPCLFSNNPIGNIFDDEDLSMLLHYKNDDFCICK